ncbi:MAG TPA: TrmH family RNA methyltransferase [Baekduia sp.]|nr:TrmH family RNA methyltransferase [Baekduia sp.]
MTPAPDSGPFFGIGIAGARKAGNLGALARSGHAFGASLVFAIGFQPTQMDASVDTTKASRHLSLAEYSTIAEFIALGPRRCELVGVEYGVDAATSLPSFAHPRRALYLLGGEGDGLGAEALAACHHLVEIPSRYPLNVATAGSIVLYDRVSKG